MKLSFPVLVRGNRTDFKGYRTHLSPNKLAKLHLKMGF